MWLYYISLAVQIAVFLFLIWIMVDNAKTGRMLKKDGERIKELIKKYDLD